MRNNYEKLETAIRQALPELMELTEGCEVQFSMYTYDCKGVILNSGQDECYVLLTKSTGLEVKHHSLEFVKRKSTIIGHPITILHLLRWLSKNDKYLGLDFDSVLVFSPRSIKWVEHHCISIDLSKPLLRDQSEEVINQLVKLSIK